MTNNGQFWLKATWETLFHWGYWIVLLAVVLGGIYWYSKREVKKLRNKK